jgi:uncharacterized protein with HEPN domain
MTKKGKKYLSDILIAIELIEQFTEEVNEFSQYQSDSKTKSAVERQLSIVGEAVNNYRKLEEQFELTNTSRFTCNALDVGIFTEIYESGPASATC